MPSKRIQSRIIELCSEDADGSWELWWSLGAKKPEERDSLCDRFIEAVQDLLNEGRVIALRKDEHNQFSVVQLDRDQLTYELQNADHCNTTSSLAVLIACLKDGSIVA